VKIKTRRLHFVTGGGGTKERPCDGGVFLVPGESERGKAGVSLFFSLVGHGWTGVVRQMDGGL
jgi:hypothetical protein